MQTISTPTNRLLFQGERATQLAQSKRISTRRIERAVLRDDTPYLGQLPDALKALEDKDGQFLQRLDELSDKLRSGSLPQKVFTDFHGIPMECHQVGQGKVGGVYRLSINGHSFAFKIFSGNPTLPLPKPVIKKLWDVLHHGPYAEAASGLFLTARNTKDVARFHVANPQSHWQLSEYIDESADVSQRSGKTLEEQGYLFQDDYKSGNLIGGIYVDYGGLQPLKRRGKMIRALSKWADQRQGITE